MAIKIGKIFSTAPPGIEECKDKKFTDRYLMPGVCSYHGGLMYARKKRNETILPETKTQTETPITFTTYAEAQNWISQQVKKYPSKNHFFASEQYKKAYPQIKALADAEIGNQKKELLQLAETELTKANLKPGDRVYYDHVTPFGVVESYTGTLFLKSGIPYVKFDAGQKTMNGKTFIKWHKGFKKIEPATQQENAVLPETITPALFPATALRPQKNVQFTPVFERTEKARIVPILPEINQPVTPQPKPSKNIVIAPAVLPQHDTEPILPEPIKNIIAPTLPGKTIFAFLSKIVKFNFTLTELKQAWKEYLMAKPAFILELNERNKPQLLNLLERINVPAYLRTRNKDKANIITEIVERIELIFAVGKKSTLDSFETNESAITNYINTLSENSLQQIKDSQTTNVLPEPIVTTIAPAVAEESKEVILPDAQQFADPPGNFVPITVKATDEKIKIAYKFLNDKAEQDNLKEIVSCTNNQEYRSAKHELYCLLQHVWSGILRNGTMRIDEPGKRGLQNYLLKKIEYGEELYLKAMLEKEIEKIKNPEPEPEPVALDKRIEERNQAILQDEPQKELPDNYYIVNSDDKAELHFDFNYYKSLSQEIKNEIKKYFLWGRSRRAWVSKAKHYNYSPQSIIKKLGLPLYKKESRKTFEEELTGKIENAEHREQKYLTRAQKLEQQAKQMRSEYDRLRQDWAWLTQPFVNTSGGRSFRNHKEKVIDRLQRSYAVSDKASDYRVRAETAAQTANLDTRYNNYGFLMRKIKEAEKLVAALSRHVENGFKVIDAINAGKQIKTYSGEIVTIERATETLDNQLRRLDFEQSKLVFLLAKKEELEENQASNIFTKERLQAMNATHVKRKGDWYKIIKLNPTTVTHTWFVGDWKTPYSEIQEAKSFAQPEVTSLEDVKAGEFTKEILKRFNATHIQRINSNEWRKIIKINSATVTTPTPDYARTKYTQTWKIPYSLIGKAKSEPAIGYISPENYLPIITNPALATATSLISQIGFKRIYYAAYRATGSNEIALYIVYYIYNRRQFTNIPLQYKSIILNTLQNIGI